MHIKPWLIVVGGITLIAVGLSAGRPPAPAVADVPQEPPSGTFAIRDVRVFDGERVLDKATVVVRDGTIAGVGADLKIPAGMPVVDGKERTLLPGLIDAHVHTFGNALQRALVSGVTTVLDMFTDHTQARQWRAEQASGGGAPGRADIFSAGTLVTAPGGHGTQFGLPIPTITSQAEAEAFVDARIAEGSDYIKIVYETGEAYGRDSSNLSEATLRAVVVAAKARGKLAVVHVGSSRAADAAITAGASGLVHLFGDEPPAGDFAQRVTAAGMFVIPTLSVIESVTGVAGSADIASASPLAPFLTPDEKAALNASFPQRAGTKVRLEHAVAATRQLHEAGVPILAGSDAPNPGTTHGATLHRELELLTRAGLSPIAALTAATSAPADAFGLADRGRITVGRRADLVLVDGDPTADVTMTRRIVEVWKSGVRLDRKPAPTEAALAEATASGRISNFDGTGITAEFGDGWQISTDTMFGGSSEAKMQLVKPGAAGSTGALEITGAIKPGAPFPWAGAMFFPASPPMSPANLSTFTEIVFHARGDGREHQVMVFSTALGNTPGTQPFTAGTEWKEFVMPLKAFGVDGAGLRGILFSAGADPGAFRFAIDQVRLR
jgi:imidazolonepropionase-like amidohydrolase